MHRAAHPFEQASDALDRVTHHRSPDVVLVVVRRQHAADRHAVGLDGVDEVIHGVRRVDEHALSGRAVTDGVHEVHHLAGDRVPDGEVAPREELAEVQPVVRAHGATLLTLVRGAILAACGEQGARFAACPFRPGAPTLPP